jgi:multiple sugar transport system ATP-binding protein
MEDGEVQQVDPPTALYDFPANRFVADFIGEPPMNIFPVTLHEDAAGQAVSVRDGPTDFRLPLPGTEDSPITGQAALLGVRPGDIHEAAPDDEATLELSVHITEPLGESLLVHGTVGDQDLTVELDAHANVSQGESVSIAVDRDRLHLFDSDTGVALYHSAERFD